MYKVFGMYGNNAGMLEHFDNYEEAQDFVIKQVTQDVKELEKDDPEADKNSLYELAVSYYSIVKDLS